MDYEKKYKEVLKVIENLYNVVRYQSSSDALLTSQTLEKAFPELKESEDEMVRKAIVKIISDIDGGFPFEKHGIIKKNALAWLENQGKSVRVEAAMKELEEKSQLFTEAHKGESSDEILAEMRGEQKPFDYQNANIQQKDFAPKIEPKFKVGDLVVDNCGYVWKIEGIINQFYILEGVEGGESRPTIEWVNKTFHLWTIQDAKDGDVLAYGVDEIPFMFKGLLDPNHPNCPVAYCGIDTEGYFSVCTINHWWTDNDNDVKPATKEQRDLLFQKMHEAGYEWDSEKKELNKNEDEEYDGADYGIDGLWHAKNILEKTLGGVVGYQTDDGILSHQCAITAVKKLYEQKSAWSEDDEKTLNEIFSVAARASLRKSTLFGKSYDYIKWQNWLKSLKGRVQPKQEWSEDDEVKINRIVACLENLKVADNDILLKDVDWLKSLRPQNRWKPSDEQMKVLDEILNFAANHESPYWNDYIFGTLTNLIRQLKKLK